MSSNHQPLIEEEKTRMSRPLLLIICLLVVCICLFSQDALGSPPQTAGQQKDTLYFVPHTHWEGAVFITREDYLQSGLVNIARALKMLKSHPNYKFALDQVAYFKPFLERYQEEEAAFRKFIAAV